MRNISEWATMDKCRIVFGSLDQVGFESIPHKSHDSMGNLQIFDGDGLVVVGIGNNDIAQPAEEIFGGSRETKDGHKLGGDGDLEFIVARGGFGIVLANGNATEGAVVHIERSLPHDFFRVDIERIALINGVVQNGSDEVDGGR